jgi:outer membrane protein
MHGLMRALMIGSSLCAIAGTAHAQDAFLGTVLEDPGSAGLGFVFRTETSPYIDGGNRDDFLPLYLYEGERFFMRANEVGVRVWHDDTMGFEAFAERRLEGYPEDVAPASLAGMQVRNTGADLGARFYLQHGASRWDLSVRHDIANLSHGTEARVGYGYTIQGDRWRLQPVALLQCVGLNDDDPTDVVGVHVGRPFVSRFNGWPLDIVGYAGVLRHLEKDRQPDGWQIDAYMKGFWYGFPWSHRVNTRLGFGIGVSYAERVPYTEVTAQALREENTSKLLNYLEPSIDVSVGDLFGSKRWHDLYFGFAVSHRSGIFGSSQLLGTVDGGSNYIDAYLEGAS